MPRSVLIAIAFLLLSTVIAVLPWLLGGVYASAYLALAVAAAVTIAVQLTAIVIEHRKLPRMPAVLWLLLAALAWGTLQSAALPTEMVRHLSPKRYDNSIEFGDTSASKQQRLSVSECAARTRSDLARLWVCALVFASGWLVRSVRTIRIAVAILAVNGIALALFGIAQRLSWNGHIYWRIKSPSYLSFASYVNHNNAGGYLTLVIALVVAVWVYNGYERWQVGSLLYGPSSRPRLRDFVFVDWRDCAFAATVFGLIVAVVLTISRGATLAMVISGLVMTATVIRSTGARARIPVFGFVVATILFVTWCGMSGQVWERFESSLQQEELVSTRVQHWKADLNMLSDYWTVGSGIGSYRYANRPYQTFESNQSLPQWFHYSENQYLETAIVAGVLGLTILFLLIVVVATHVRRLLRSRSRDTITLGVLGIGALVSQVVAATFDFGLYLSANAALFALICGWACRDLENSGDAGLGKRRWLAYCGWGTFVLYGVVAAPTLVGDTRVERIVDRATEASSRRWADRRTTNEIAGDIADMERELRWMPNDVMANVALGSLYLEKNQAELYQQLTDETGTAGNQELWIRSSTPYLHAIANEATSAADRKTLLNHPILVANLGPSWQATQTALRSCELSAQGHYQAALTRLLATGDTTSNDRSIKNALRLSPQSAPMHFRAAALALAEGNRDFGLNLFAQSIWLGRELTIEHIRYANLMLTASELARCMPDDDQTLIRIANSKSARWAKPEHRQVILDGALSAIDRSDQAAAGIAYEKFDLLRALGFTEEAESALHVALEHRPSNVAWRFTLAQMLFKRGALKESLAELQHCLKLDANNAEYKALFRRVSKAIQKESQR